MRRWLLLFLCAVLSISTAHRLFAQEATLRVLDGAGDPGSEENPVFVELTNASQVSIVQFALNFDGTLLSVAGVQPTGRTEHMGTFSWVVLDSGAVVVHIEDLTGEVIDPGVGPVVTFFFDVAEEGLGGEVPLHLPEEGARLFGPASDSISVRVIDGTFRVTVPDISLSAYSHNYGYILMDHSEAWELTIYNGGTGVLTILEVTSDNFEFSVTSPSFPQDVAPDDSLKVVVTFSPSLEGPRSASVSISSNDPDEGLISLSLTGGGTSVDIELSATDHDFNTVRVGSSSDWPVAIYNLGVDDLTVFDIVSDHSDFGVAYPSFPQIVSPAGSLEVILRFQPASMGTLTATLTLTCDDPDEGTILLGVTGVGVAPDIQLSAISHDFGDVEVGTSEGWLLTLFNVGTVDLTVSTVSSDNEDFTVTFPPFPQTIQPGGDLEVIISFVPSNVGERAASLTISSDDPFDSTLVISLNGRGVPSATLHVGQGSGAPGSTGNPVPLLLTNRTSVMALRCILTYNASKLQISNVSPTVRTDRMGIFTWSEPLAGKVVLLIEDLTGREIMPGAGPVANLLFDVASPVFPTEEPLTLSNVALYDPDGEDIFTLFDEPGSFTIIAPEITLSATSHTFGSVVLGNSVTWTLEILNDGTVDLAVTGVTSTHSDFSVLTPSFPQTVAPGGSLEVAVRFTPTSLGPVAGAITVVSDDPDEGLLSVPVTGEGVVPHIELSAYSHNYGEVVLETPSSWSMKVYNTGTADLVVTRVTVDRADFAVTSPPFPQTVEASDSLTVAVGFSPSSLGTITGTLTIFSNDPEQGELSVFLTGVGIAPEIDVPESSHNFGEVVVGGMSSWVMRVFNIGTADLILHNITSDRVDF
ncbi:MAG: choice-of-anchor D domain-containing protein, partial [bacterium]